MKLTKVKIQLEGVTALIMHNGQTRDPDNECSIRKDALTKRKDKTRETREEISRVEWEASLYWDENLGLYLPQENLQTCFIKAAKRTRDGRKAIAFFIDQPNIPFLEPRPKSIEAMWKDKGKYLFRRAVVQKGTAIVRSRARIPTPWLLEFTARLDEDELDFDRAGLIQSNAGKLEGLCDWRPGAPKMPGPWGCFTVKVFQPMGDWTQ